LREYSGRCRANLVGSLDQIRQFRLATARLDPTTPVPKQIPTMLESHVVCAGALVAQNGPFTAISST